MGNKYKIILFLLMVSIIIFPLRIILVRLAEGDEEITEETIADGSEVQLLAFNDRDFNEDLNMNLVSQNEHLELYLNQETAEFAITQIKSGETWFSNPVDREDDSIVSGENRGLLNSQLILNYYNPNGQTTRMESSRDSVLMEQVEMEYIENGFKVTYTFGAAAMGFGIIPQRISSERFETVILDRIEDNRLRGDLQRRYRYIEEEDVWERRDASFPALIMERTNALLEEIGYTEDDLDFDNSENMYSGESIANHPYFAIPLIVQLDGEDLLVSIPTNEVEYNERYPIRNIHLLPFFGAANDEEEGYMLVPDGSGALIDLNNNKSNYQPFNAPVYGNDKAVFSKEESLLSETVRLPVYGMKQTDKAFFAIIESGDAVASIHADVAGRLNQYNTIHSRFLINEVGEVTLSGGERSSTVSMIQKDPFDKDILVRFGFLQGEDATYNGMATYYQGYLVEKHDLEPVDYNDNIPFYLDVVGSIWKRNTFLGIPYKTLEPLTTFEETQSIIEELQTANVQNLKLRYTGWFNEGVDHKIPKKVSVDRQLGGSQGLEDFSEFLTENGIDFYPDVAFMMVNRNSFGFSPNRDASRFITRRVAEIYPYNPASYTIDRSKSVQYILSPSKLDSFVDSFIEEYQLLKIDGVSLRDLGNELNSDFREKDLVNREETKILVEEQLNKFSDTFANMLTIGGNSMVLPYTDHILEIPTNSSEFNITDRSIPFYQMVIHGYIDYAGSPVNISSNQSVRYHTLKAMETGSNVYFQWFYTDPSIVKETEFNYLYSSNYELWFEEAVEMYQQVNEVLKNVRTLPITAHEELANGVYKTTYGSDYSVIVNYNNKEVVIDGIAIGPEDYKIRQGE